MPRRAWITAATCSLLAIGPITATIARADGFTPRLSSVHGTQRLDGDAVGSLRAPAAGPHVGSHGGTIVVDDHGLLVVERNAGAVVRSDLDGNPQARLQLHEALGEIVHDGAGQVFVADRAADRVVRVAAGDDTGQGLAEAGAVEVSEPHGLALTPDGRTLLVTSVAEHQLVAIDTATLKIQWRRELAAEPRGVAVSADGSRAAVGFLTSGALAVVDLAAAGRQVRWHSLDPRDHIDIEEDDAEEGFGAVAELREARSRFQVPTDAGRRQARAVFAVGFLGGDMMVAPHQLATPQMKLQPAAEVEDSYGGGAESIPRLIHRVARLDQPGAQVAKTAMITLEVHQPRSLAYRLDDDTMFVGGYGDDQVIAVRDASQHAPYVRWSAQLGSKRDACGIDGLVHRDDSLWVHCELSRRVVRLDLNRVSIVGGQARAQGDAWHTGPQLADSLRPELVERGAELFRRGNDRRMSDGGVLACASCHPEGRADGLTWRLGKSILQTPVLAGRLQGTAPYKWDGQDEDIDDSLHHTIRRLGGFPEDVRRREFEGLRAYVMSMTPPRPPEVSDPEAVARGKTLFQSKELGCDACHVGDKLADGSQYVMDGRRWSTDTPSLLGLAHSAPYYHDGSAGDLRTLLTDRGNVHDMAELGSLSEAQVGDLTAYLRTF